MLLRNPARKHADRGLDLVLYLYRFYGVTHVLKGQFDLMDLRRKQEKEKERHFMFLLQRDKTH